VTLSYDVLVVAIGVSSAIGVQIKGLPEALRHYAIPSATTHAAHIAGPPGRGDSGSFKGCVRAGFQPPSPPDQMPAVLRQKVMYSGDDIFPGHSGVPA